MKKALITGISGQDGSYLAELLLEKGYEVCGLLRRTSGNNISRILHLARSDTSQIKIIYGDLLEGAGLAEAIRRIRPDEIYNLGAQSHVRISFDIPEYTANVTGLGTLRILDVLKNDEFKNIRFYQASSSELFGNSAVSPQNEETAFNPCSPYAAAKAYSYYITKNYREAYGLFASNGILFNHESPRRGAEFVTRKITLGLARIKYGLQSKLLLGNLEARRDWGYAKDYVEAMWRMLQCDLPHDLVIATGENHSVREFLDRAAEIAKVDWRKYVDKDPRYFRPTEVHSLLGDSSRAREILNWKPSITFDELVRLMMESDLRYVRSLKEGELVDSLTRTSFEV